MRRFIIVPAVVGFLSVMFSSVVFVCSASMKCFCVFGLHKMFVC